MINQQLHAFVCPEHVDPYFLSHALQMQKSYMEAIAHFTTIAYLNKTKCNSLPIPLPTIEEQRKISTQLKAIGHKIEAEEQRKAALQALFKAMPHQLMTGQIRLSAGADFHCTPF